MASPDKFLAFGKSGRVRLDGTPRGRQVGRNTYRITMTRDGNDFIGEGTSWRRAWEVAHFSVSWYVVAKSRSKKENS